MPTAPYGYGEHGQDIADDPRVVKLTEVNQSRVNNRVTCEHCLRAAVKQPSLFFRKPATIIRHVDLITGLYRRGFLRFNEFPNLPQTAAASVLEYLVRNPHLFLMSDDNIDLRETYAHATDARPSKKILMKSRRRIERELAQALSFHSPQDKSVQSNDPRITRLLQRTMLIS